MRPRALVHHPGSNHLAYQLVAALQAGGFDCDFETGFFYAQDGMAARLIRRLPERWRGRIERELKRRSHAGVDPVRLRLHPLPELAYVALARAGATGATLSRAIGLRNIWVDRLVAARVRRERPDIVIGHDGSALLAQRAARATGALAVLNQVIGHIEEGHRLFAEEAALVPDFAGSLVRAPDWIVARCAAEAREADLVLVPSDYVRDTMERHGVAAERIAVLPYGVDVERFRPRDEPRRDGKFRVLFVGHLSQRKGLKYLLEAMKRLGLPDAELVLVGRRMTPEAALAPYRGLFRHVPHVPFHEVHRLFQDADAFVYPSLHEGSAFATYEALASGLPTIVTPNAGSVVRDGVEGFVTPIRDADALATKIETLYRDPALRAAMAAAARRRALEFTWAHYGERLGAILNQRVGRR